MKASTNTGARLVKDAVLRDELGRRGRAYVEARYSLEAYEQRLLEVFPAG